MGDNNDNSPVITLKEALEEYEQLEKVSTAVLGASDPQNCSYDKGYIKRQALYACLTCNPKGAPFFQPAGVCLACSYKCHDGHELVELYTKRNFRCDCGNKKFPDNPCFLVKEKDELNEQNSYNQNFTGLYCTCNRPYPDPEESEENVDPMIQCIVCEDWHHTQHAIPGINWADYDDEDQSLEMICGLCTPKISFLGYYDFLQAKPKHSETAHEEQQQKLTDNVKDLGDVVKESSTSCDNNKVDAHGIEDSSSQDSGIASIKGTDVGMSTCDAESTSSTCEDKECQLIKLSKIQLKDNKGTLWSDGWRKKLCRCTECKALYESLKVSFVIDDEDTMECYEAVGHAKSESDKVQAEESLNRQIDSLGRVGQIELISGYNDMKEALKDFLKEFAENEKVVQPKDVQEFFENLRASKRPRLDPSFQ